MDNSTSGEDSKAAATYRWLENGHILLWLIKDTCWVTVWRPGGMFMILPTLSMAVYLTWRSRRIRAELFHNIAVCLWIAANSVWMTGEFFEWELRPVAVVLFAVGLATGLVYYICMFPADYRKLREKNAPPSDGGID